MQTSLVALSAGVANVGFLVFSALSGSTEKQGLYKAVCDTTLFLSLTLLLANGVAT